MGHINRDIVAIDRVPTVNLSTAQSVITIRSTSAPSWEKAISGAPLGLHTSCSPSDCPVGRDMHGLMALMHLHNHAPTYIPVVNNELG